jgi:hypothetical protein
MYNKNSFLKGKEKLFWNWAEKIKVTMDCGRNMWGSKTGLVEGN